MTSQRVKDATDTAGERFVKIIERLQNEPAPRQHFPNNLRDLDQEIYLLLELYQTDDEGCALLYMAPHYTTSLDAAISLVPKGWEWTVSNRAPKPHAGRAYINNRELHFAGISISPNPKYRGHERTAANTALALCIVCLEALTPAATSDNKPERSIADETGGGK